MVGFRPRSRHNTSTFLPLSTCLDSKPVWCKILGLLRLFLVATTPTISGSLRDDAIVGLRAFDVSANYPGKPTRDQTREFDPE